MGRIVNFMFVDTVLAVLAWQDTGACAKYDDEPSCILTSNIDQVKCVVLCKY